MILDLNIIHVATYGGDFFQHVVFGCGCSAFGRGIVDAYVYENGRRRSVLHGEDEVRWAVLRCPPHHRDFCRTPGEDRIYPMELRNRHDEVEPGWGNYLKHPEFEPARACRLAYW